MEILPSLWLVINDIWVRKLQFFFLPVDGAKITTDIINFLQEIWNAELERVSLKKAGEESPAAKPPLALVLHPLSRVSKQPGTGLGRTEVGRSVFAQEEGRKEGVSGPGEGRDSRGGLCHIETPNLSLKTLYWTICNLYQLLQAQS